MGKVPTYKLDPFFFFKKVQVGIGLYLGSGSFYP